MSRRQDAKLKKLFTAIADEEAAVNIRPRYRGFMRGVYLVGIKRHSTVIAKRNVKLLHELGILSAALLILTAASAPRLFGCVKPDGDWMSANVTKQQCLKYRDDRGRPGRWLPKGDDMPIQGTRA